jgi:hypothetical protein
LSLPGDCFGIFCFLGTGKAGTEGFSSMICSASHSVLIGGAVSLVEVRCHSHDRSVMWRRSLCNP